MRGSIGGSQGESEAIWWVKLKHSFSVWSVSFRLVSLGPGQEKS